MSFSAVILAAGRGSRLSEQTDIRPKAILPIGTPKGETAETNFLRRQSEIIHRAGGRVIIVVGYRREMVEEEIKSWGFPVDIAVNPTPEIKTSGSLHSLQFATRDFPELLHGTSPLYFMDADILYHRDVFSLFLESGTDTATLLCKEFEESDEEVMIFGASADRPTFIAKGLTSNLCGGAICLGEATGIVRVGEKEQKLTAEIMNWMLGDPDAPADALARRGFSPAKKATEHEELSGRLMQLGLMRAVSFSKESLPFMECDTAAEYHKLRNDMFPRIQQMENR